MGFLGDVFDFLTNARPVARRRGHPDACSASTCSSRSCRCSSRRSIALPIGIVLGHVRTGGAIAVNIANIGRALPALALLILAVQWVGIGEPDRRPHARCSRCPAFIAMVALAVPPMLANAYVGVAERRRRDPRGGAGHGHERPPDALAGRAADRDAADHGRRAHRDGRGGRDRDARGATSTPAGFGRYIVDGFAVHDNVKVFAGGLLVALLAIALELVLALVQRAITSPGIRTEGRIKVRDLATDRLAPAGHRALSRRDPT